MSAFYTLLYVAPTTDAEAIAIDADQDAVERYPNLWMDHIGDLELVELWEILDAEGNAGTLMEDMVYSSTDGEVMVLTVPEEFVAAVARLGKDDLKSVAAIWQTSETMVNWSVPELLALLVDLSEVCKRSVSDKQPVLQVASM